MRLLLIPALLFTTFAFAAEGEAPVATKPYPLTTCAVSDEKLDSMDEAVTKTYKGQEVKFCCNKCVKKFEKDIDGNLEKIDKKAKEAAAAPAAETPHAH